MKIENYKSNLTLCHDNDLKILLTSIDIRSLVLVLSKQAVRSTRLGSISKWIELKKPIKKDFNI